MLKNKFDIILIRINKINMVSIYDYLKPCLVFITTILFISTIQWLLIQVYIGYCCIPSLEGIFTNILSLGSPLCHFINTVQYRLSENYIALWIGGGTMLITYLNKLFK